MTTTQAEHLADVEKMITDTRELLYDLTMRPTGYSPAADHARAATAHLISALRELGQIQKTDAI